MAKLKHNRETILWGLISLAYLIVLVLPECRNLLNKFTGDYPYIIGFINFAILSTMGGRLASRLSKGVWEKDSGILARMIMWGVIGIIITLVFQLFSYGVICCMENGYLPPSHNKLVIAMLTSILMNILFAPTFMLAQNIVDTYISIQFTTKTKVRAEQVIQNINWENLITFVYLKTIPFFWIPAHTIVFLLPKEYQVIMASFLSIILGILLSGGQKIKKAR